MICESYNKLVPWVLWILCFSLLVFLLNKSCDFTWSTEITSYGLWWWESYCVITWMCKTVHRSNYVGSLLALSFDFLVYHWHMTSIKLLYMQSVTKHQCVSPCTMLQNHNIAWRNFNSLFLNIIKRGEGVETENCPNSSFSHNFCHWLSKKNWKIKCSISSCSFYIKLKVCNYPLRHNFAIVSSYLNNCNIKNSFWNDEKVIWYG